MSHFLHPRRGAFWMVAALVFGLLILPFLVHLTGRTVLGAYSGGVAGAFFGDYLRSLLQFRWYAWVLALGPLLIVVFWRILARTPSGGRVDHGSG